MDDDFYVDIDTAATLGQAAAQDGNHSLAIHFFSAALSIMPNDHRFLRLRVSLIIDKAHVLLNLNRFYDAAVALGDIPLCIQFSGPVCTIVRLFPCFRILKKKIFFELQLLPILQDYFPLIGALSINIKGLAHRFTSKI